MTNKRYSDIELSHYLIENQYKYKRGLTHERMQGLLRAISKEYKKEYDNFLIKNRPALTNRGYVYKDAYKLFKPYEIKGLTFENSADIEKPVAKMIDSIAWKLDNLSNDELLRKYSKAV